MFEERPALTSQFNVSNLQKTALKCDTESFGPVSQLWSVTHKCMHDSKQHHNWLM